MVEQRVEIAFGLKETLERGCTGRLARRVSPDRVQNAEARVRRQSKVPKEPRTPRVAKLLRKAQEWRRQLDTGDLPSQADIARREGITRARVSQIMAMLRLSLEIQERILSLPDVAGRPPVTERALRPIIQSNDPGKQQDLFEAMILRTE